MATPTVLTIETSRIIRTAADRALGINLNYLRDADANRPEARTLVTALKDIHATWLRYPGGEKSDFHQFAAPPYTTAAPVSMSWYAGVEGTRLTFDEYIATAQAVGATPYVVAGYDSEARSGLTQAQWLEHAVAWVRYANVTHRYGVRYWEIGNENWHNETAPPQEMARIVLDFSQAMKAVDPAIQVGASGSTKDWWATFLPIAAPGLDFLSVSLYNAWQWQDYGTYARVPAPYLISEVQTAASAIASDAPAAARGRLGIIVSETNSIDWSANGWPQRNTLGHALVTFDTLGKLLQHPKVLAAMVWTTRWINDAEAESSQYYALGPRNEIKPTGRALQLWGRFLRAHLVRVTGAKGMITAYASCGVAGSPVVVWIINRGLTPVRDVEIKIQSRRPFRTATVYQLRGTGPDDTKPRYGRLGTITPIVANHMRALHCPGVSITVLRCT